jgi:septum formation protein
MTLPSPKLVLASRSPRRRELLEEAGYRFEVWPPSEQSECGLCSDENPIELVTRLAYQKAADVARRIEEKETDASLRSEPADEKGTGASLRSEPVPRIVIGCDTVVECGGQVMGKPADEVHARQMLGTLSGQEHRVLSGLCLWKTPGGDPRLGVAITTLRMDRLSPAQLDEYLASGQWEGKAGAFGYQDRLGWVHIVEGSESNVVGLPMELLADMLKDMH